MAFDLSLFYFFNNFAGQTAFVDQVILFCAESLPYIMVVAALLVPRRTVKMLAFAFGSGLVARFGVVELIRVFVHRPRPFETLEVAQLLPHTAWSFPSGHAAFFFAFSTAVYLYNKKWGIGLFIASLLVSLSRVAAGLHYPSDILAGALVGIVTASLLYFFVQKVTTKAAPGNSPDLLTR